MPAVSVILPTRDRPGLVGRALASALAQQGTDFEVVLVDNNQAVSRISQQMDLQALLADKRVHVVEATDAQTAGAARNAGLREATGEWVTFLDDDDEYVPAKIARQLKVARATGSPLVLCGYEVDLGIRRRRIQVERNLFTGDEMLLDAVWGTPFLFLRREGAPLFRDDLAAGEDLVFAFTAIERHGLDCVPSVPEPLVRVHLQPPGARVNMSHEAHWHAHKRVLEDLGRGFSSSARRRFRLRAELQRAKGDHPWSDVLACACRLVSNGGWAEWRRAGNALAYRSRWLRPYIVS